MGRLIYYHCRWEIIVGATHENDQGFDLKDSQELQQKMYEEACEVFPVLKQAKWSW